MPVVAAALHSQLPAVAVAFKARRGPTPRLAYVMTDGAGLPLALSDLVADAPRQGSARRHRSPAATRSAATTRRCRCSPRSRSPVTSRDADAAVVVMGPGIVGTNTRLGFSGMEVGPILDAAAALGGVPIACLRVSFADARDRHRGSVAPQRHRAAPRVPRAGARSRCPSSPAPSRPRACAPISRPPGIDRRHDLVDVDAPDALALFDAARARASCRWGGRPPTIPRCSRPRPRPARSRPRRATPDRRRARVADRLERLSTSPRRCSTPAAR